MAVAMETDGVETQDGSQIQNASSRRAPRASPADIVQSPPGPWASGRVACPWCSDATYGEVSGLVRHFSTVHSGRSLDDDGVNLLRALDRGICSNGGCGGICRVGSRQCIRCGRTTRLRPPVVGDIVQGPASTARVGPSLPDASAAPADVAATADAVQVGDATLPADFTARVRRLPANTVVHIPIECRARMAEATAECWEGLADGRQSWSLLEEGRSKLLLSSIPDGAHVPKEVATRLALFRRKDYEELLSRVEGQAASRRQNIRRGRRGGKLDHRQSKAKRAKLQAREGAYRKAVGGLTSEMESFSPEDDRKWADALLPKTSSTDGVLSAPISTSDSLRPDRPQFSNPARHDAGDDDWPLKGVRYSALTAPGPSGMRPEHLKELLGVRQRAASNRLLRSLARVHEAFASGNLGTSARWLLRTRLVWIKKKLGPAPRPVQIGEVLRTSYAKHIVRAHESSLRPKLLSMRQWGLAMPGGAEAMVHWRSTMEDLAMSGHIAPLVALDLDLKNMFGTIEWPKIRAAVAEHLPSISSWTQWTHQQPMTTVLPSMSEAVADRGTGQGDPLGTVQAVLPLGDARRDAHADFSNESPLRGKGVCDEWFVDDGQALVRPHLVDSWLKCLDRALAGMGATRGEGEGVKSSARLLCPMAMVASCAGWDAQYVRRTCEVLANNATTKVLGAAIGCSEDITEDARSILVNVLHYMKQ